MGKALIAIVGRPNVGKSTFFNRVLEQRKAIVDAQEGITRDRLYGAMEWAGHTLTFIDTGGYIPEDLDMFNAAVRKQAQVAIHEADLVLLMVDGRVNPTASDHVLARFVRATGKPLALVVNKCDTPAQDSLVNAYYELGIEPVLPVSALTGRLTGDLLTALVEALQLTPDAATAPAEAHLRLAIIGMPNVGKSSLVNALVRKERTMVTPIPGTTRDAVDTELKWYGKWITLIDTAGLRKKSKVQDQIEFYSGVRTLNSIRNCDVAVVVVDAPKGFTKQDKAIVEMVIDYGKGLVVAVNKWDLIEKDTHTLTAFQREMVAQYKPLSGYPILFISAKTKQRVSRLLEVAHQVYQAWQQRIPTQALNAFLDQTLKSHPVPAVKGKVIRIKYMTQVRTAPPVLVCFTNYPKLIPVHFRRYVENQLRDQFHLQGVPLRLAFRKA
jgi:GTP-binding protein